MDDDACDEEKRLTSIRYILRRRKRANRIGLSVGDKKQSWAQFQAVSISPSSGYSNRHALGCLLFGGLAIGFPIFLFVLMGTTPIDGETGLSWNETPWFAWILYGFLGLVAVVAIVLCSWIIFSGLWRIIRSNFKA